MRVAEFQRMRLTLRRAVDAWVGLGGRAMSIAIAGAFAALLIGPCQAAPPAAGSEQAEILLPHRAWVKSLQNPVTKQQCCDLADCRVVIARIKGNHYEAFIGRDVFGRGAPNDWLPVPDEVVLRDGSNPVGLPVACWKASRQPLYNGYFCFHDGSAS